VTAGRRSPAKRDAAKTRGKILDAATREFSKNGLSGARVDAICRAARVNPRMIYHYFSDKTGLYIAVLENVLSELRTAEMKLDFDHTPPDHGIAQLFEFIHAHFGAHPELMNLLSGENLLRAQFLRRSRNVQTISSPLLGLIDKLLRRGEAAGMFRAGIDSLHLYVVMVALSYFHRSNAFTLSVIFATDLLDRRWQKQHKHLVGALLTNYLAAPRARAP
jgi:AcrR family transcriptional regulator